MSARYLTKSRFKLALECETKLFYSNKKEYFNSNADDPFLEALAEGGYQVEELAKLYHPGGVEVNEREYDKVVEHTNELLKKEQVVIYQAAFRYENLFIRADILVKEGKRIELIEVKAKSFRGRDSMDLLNRGGWLESKWIPYVYDVAFQKYVIMNAFPEYEVWSYLMMADKNARTSVDGLNQIFLISKDKDGSTRVKNKADSQADLGNKILIKIKIDDIIERIYAGEDTEEAPSVSFAEKINRLAKYYQEDHKYDPILGSKCRDCEFKCGKEEMETGLRSGFHECWKQAAGFKDQDFDKPSVLDLWDYKWKDQAIAEGKYFMHDLTDDDIGETRSQRSGMTRTERQRIQIRKAIDGDDTMDLRKEELREEMDSWKYPLHFIDFETTAVAIPFHKNMGPYEGIAFQFSHHTVDEFGNIKHAGEYINTKPGFFPNFEFVRKLKEQLEQDEGTIFRYAAHENTYLNLIYTQLREANINEVPDKEELCEWIKSITYSTSSQAEEWEGTRNMVDLCEMVKRFYYDPYTKGSNSIKALLPAVLNRSKTLQAKYSQPIYGTSVIPSRNFKDKAWIEILDGEVLNPYKKLDPLFEGKTDEQLAEYITDSNLADGGAAMLAYAKMQFTEMSEEERELVINGLKRYCELDTFAMVLIWEFWREEVNG